MQIVLVYRQPFWCISLLKCMYTLKVHVAAQNREKIH